MSIRLPAESGWAFWSLAGLLVLMDAAVMWRSVEAGIAIAAALGLAALVATVFGTEKGTLAIGLVLLVVTLVLPTEMALRYRVAVGGGGIFIVDILYALVVASWLLLMVARGYLGLVRSPVTLPLALFVAWALVGSALIGRQAGNPLKFVLQDWRNLSYFLLFFWTLTVVRDLAAVRMVLKVLAVCAGIGFVIGLYYYATGQGMELTYVQSGVSRFPAPNEVFVMGTTLAGTMLVAWPAGRRRPWYLWVLLVVCVLGVVLSLVRGYWIGLAVGAAYMLVITSTQQRLRLVGGAIAGLLLLTTGLALLQPSLLQSVATRAQAVSAYRNDPSVQHRLIENRAVQRQIAQRPLLGNGLGKEFVYDASRFGLSPYTEVYIHNNYLWLAQRLGLLGLGLFGWAIGAFLFGWRDVRPYLARTDGVIAGLIIGSRVMIVTLLTISLASPQFHDKGNITVIVVVMALAEVARRRLVEAEEAGAPSANGAPASSAAQTALSARSSASA